jgi:threonine dehydratase
MTVKFENILTAANRIQPYIFKTPLLESHILNEKLGRRLLVKAECLQHTGSFKMRGAANAVYSLPDNVKHIVAFSSGSHAIGSARAAALRGLGATIVMPKDAPPNKMQTVKSLGAEIVTYTRFKESREEIGAELAKKYNAELIPSFDDPRIIAGQGTVGLEIAQQAMEKGAKPDTVIACVGGGGLCSGLSIAVHEMMPDVEILCAEPEFYDDTKRSIESGKIIPVADTSVPTICDAVVNRRPGNLTFPIMKQHLSGGVVISEKDTLKTIHTLFKYFKIVVEPGGALATAAVLTGQHPNNAETIVAVATGGNIEPTIFTEALKVDPYFEYTV